MKLLLRVGLFLLVVSPLAFLLTTDLFVRTEPKPPPSPSPRPATFRVCPGVSVGAVPQRLVLIKRDLKNLGSNVMGRSILYSGGGRRVWVAVGFDVLDALEDLDFTEESVLELERHRVNVTTTDIISTHRVRAATWEDERFEPPCDEFTAVTVNLTRREFVNVIDGIDVVYGESRHGGIGSNQRPS